MYEREPPLITYLNCYKLTKRWKTHSEERVLMASLLSERYYHIGVRRRASLEVTKTVYRELEEYAEETEVLIERPVPKRIPYGYFQPYGKVYEKTVYVTYREKRRTRTLEIRAYHSIPLHVSIINLARSEEFERSFMDLITDILLEYNYFFAEFSEYDQKHGIRYHLGGQYIRLVGFEHVGRTTWCNRITRAPLYTFYIEVFDVNYSRLSVTDVYDVYLEDSRLVVRYVPRGRSYD